MAFGMQLGHEYGKLLLSIFRLFAMVGIGYYLVNLAHWQPAQRQPPTQEMTYIGQMIRAWAVFPWESHEETDAVLEGEPLQPAWKRSTQP